MKIAVSACLLGEACRYDGKSKPCSEVISFLQHHESIPVCPEIMGGLSIPHPPSEIQTLSSDLLVKDADGKDTTAFFEKGAQVALKKALEKGVTHAIFKAKSPSCSVDEIYDGTFTRTLVPGDGVAVRLFKEAGIRVATEDTFKKVFRTS